MTFTYRKAAASEAKLLIGLYAESGRGKTKSALLLAKGFAGDMGAVAMIETESGRGEAYADDPIVGGYNVLSMREDFSPKQYGAAISTVEREGARVLIVDSASHEWEGVGGVLAMAAKNQEDGKKGPLVWQRPKIDHQREFMLRLMQTPIPLVIVCMRAKYVMEEIVKGGQKEWARSKDLSPKQSEDVLYEMFCHAWIDEEHRLHVTKFTLDDMRKVFIDGEPITVATGERLAAWAAVRPPPLTAPPSSADASGEFITPDQCLTLETLCQDAGIPTAKLREKANVPRLGAILAADYARALSWIEKHSDRSAPP